MQAARKGFACEGNSATVFSLKHPHIRAMLQCISNTRLQANSAR